VSVAYKVTVFATFISVACSFILSIVGEVSTAAAAAEVFGPLPHAERKMSKEQAATNLIILIPMLISFSSNIVYFGLFIFYKKN
jgi:hypothetical protein